MSRDYKSIASKYIEKYNLSVTPVRDKIPILDSWQTIAGSDVLSFGDAWEAATGVGLLCGEPSGIICLDIDITEEMTHLLPIREALLSQLPPILLGKIGNPKKPPSRFFNFNGEKARKWKYIHVELLSTGNQTVMPYSKHPDFGEYTWSGRSIKDVDLDDLPNLSDSIIKYLDEVNEREKERVKANRVRSSRGESVLPNDGEYTPGRCRHGSHNHISAWALGKYRAKKITRDDLIRGVLSYDKKYNASADKLYFECPSRKWRSSSTLDNAGVFVDEIFKNNPTLWGSDRDRILNKSEATSRGDRAESSTGSIGSTGSTGSIDEAFTDEIACGFTHIDENGKPIRHYFELMDYMAAKHHVMYLPEVKSYVWWNGKCFEYRAEEYIKKFMQEYMHSPDITKPIERNTFVDLIKATHLASVDDFVMKDKECINLRNGIFDLKTRQLIPHDPKFCMMNYIDVDYVPDAKCPVWDELLIRVFQSESSHIKAFHEFIGYALSGCNYDKFNKFLILDGEGANGKSTLLSIIQNLMGKKAISSTPLKDISTHKFAAYTLVNKLLNICSEEGKEAFSDTGPLKKLTGNDPVMAEAKFQGAFPYINMAKFIITYNNVPYFPDGSSGMRRRIILIPCEQNFELYPELKIERPVEIITAEELPGVLLRCINAYLAVLDRKSFTRVTRGEAKVLEMVEESNPVMQFIKEEIIVTQNWEDIVSCELIWSRFKEFQGGHTKMTRQGFLKRLPKHLSPLGAEKYQNRNFRGYRKIQLV
jgi:P4 family phage/plasmid primase-like protien